MYCRKESSEIAWTMSRVSPVRLIARASSGVALSHAKGPRLSSRSRVAFGLLAWLGAAEAAFTMTSRTMRDQDGRDLPRLASVSRYLGRREDAVAVEERVRRSPRRSGSRRAFLLRGRRRG